MRRKGTLVGIKTERKKGEKRSGEEFLPQGRKKWLFKQDII